MGPGKFASLAGIERYAKLQGFSLYRVSGLEDMGRLRRLKQLSSVDSTSVTAPSHGIARYEG
ncbi:MAG: hypothetical protein ACREXP_19745, partial [Steroidobacteraceae bacterium]